MNLKEIEFAARVAEKVAPEAEQATAALLKEAGFSGAGKFFYNSKDSAQLGRSIIGDSSALSMHEGSFHETAYSAEIMAQVGNPFKSNLNLDRSLAYKVLDLEGRSPAAPTVQWSLPTQLEDGSWKAGEWMHLENTPENATFMTTRRAIHVSNVPEQWSLGHQNVRVFEAELAGRDGSIWKKLLDGKALSDSESHQYGMIPATLRDFPASSVRLIREINK